MNVMNRTSKNLNLADKKAISRCLVDYMADNNLKADEITSGDELLDPLLPRLA